MQIALEDESVLKNKGVFYLFIFLKTGCSKKKENNLWKRQELKNPPPVRIMEQVDLYWHEQNRDKLI